jgi:hypothetical protein
VIGQCLVNMSILSVVPKVRALHRGPQTQNGDILKNGSHNVINFQ